MAVVFVSALLSEKMVRGCSEGYIRAVKLQQRNVGCVVDDVVCFYERADGEGITYLQVKHGVKFTESDSSFIDSMTQVWRQFTRQDFDEGLHRVGIGLDEGSYIQKIRQHQEVLEWARKSETSVSFFQKLSGFQAKKAFVELVRSVLQKHASPGLAITDDRMWRFLKVFLIIAFDFESDQSREQVQTLNILADIVPQKSSEAALSLAADLYRSVTEYAIRGGEITLDGLETYIPQSVIVRLPESVRRNSRTLLSQLHTLVNASLAKQRNTGKYVPDLFVETSDSKDLIRKFVDPVFFFQQAIDEIDRIPFSHINKMCVHCKIPTLTIDALLEAPVELCDVPPYAGNLVC